MNLSASAYHVPDPDSKSYLVYGAAISEVIFFLLLSNVIFQVEHEFYFSITMDAGGDRPAHRSYNNFAV